MKNQFRLKHAVRLLKEQNTTLTLDAIGKESGFASNSNFYQCFKEEYGLTPAHWIRVNATTAEIDAEGN